jgi:putative endonuclease
MRGELRAARWYEAEGYEVLARNWRSAEGEIDLVCARIEGGGTGAPPPARVLVVCEVKSRSSAVRGHPLEAVTAAKQRRVRRLAARFLAGQRRHFDHVRFDVAAVSGSEIDVVQDAF